ncbi:MAG TPA: R3H domain-containing nucleic acid-binding protein [Jiangellaceae bacterium]|nr:R3H domain-containing nucleic acid-binding protein [Jiangellaceae bacterium]
MSDAVPPPYLDAPESGGPSSPGSGASSAGPTAAAETVDTTTDPEPAGSAASLLETDPGQARTAEGVSTTTMSSERLRTLEREGDVAADYLEVLLDIADFDGDIDMDVEGDRAMVSVVGAELDELVGEDGEVLEALQELTRLAVIRETGERSRLMLDVGGYRARKRADLTALAMQRVEEARSTGDPVALSPMTPFERKVVHDAVAAAGLRSESEGEEPERYVVVLPR